MQDHLKNNVLSGQGNGFKLLYSYLRESWQIGRGKFNLWAYWFVCIVGIGGCGVWASIVIQVKGWCVPDALLALITLAPSIVAAACLDFIFDQEKKRFLIGFSVVVGFVVGLLDVVSLLTKNSSWPAYLLAILAMVISYATWWIANVRNTKLSDSVNYVSPIGSVTNDVGGSKEGFEL